MEALAREVEEETVGA
ncbi:hypothetical protein ACFFS2_29540 [Streptomyces aurantiacus]|nr:hypothetical protein [Streptomyces aurantiacus]